MDSTEDLSNILFKFVHGYDYQDVIGFIISDRKARIIGSILRHRKTDCHNVIC
jgi:hypothetical protein